MHADLLATVVAALESAGIPHMVTGSLASTLHGEPRATRDMDLVVDPTVAEIAVLVDDLLSRGLYVGDGVRAVESHDMFNVIDTTSGWKVDLIVRKDRPFSRSEFDRRQPVVMDGVSTFVTTPEDAILSKLEWSRMSGSSVQRRDVVEMIVANAGTLNRSYLDHWAAELGILDLLGQVFVEAGGEPGSLGC